MDGARRELLAGAALAFDQDRYVGWRDALEDREHFAHRQGFTEQLAKRARLRRHDLSNEPAGLNRHRGIPEVQHGTHGELRLGNLGASKEGTVTAAEVLHGNGTAVWLD